jgi:hypothetical protein
MRTTEAQRIILELLAGKRSRSGSPTGRVRPRRMREWDLARAARPLFRNSHRYLLPTHIERALFARALRRLRHAGLVRLSARLPGEVWAQITRTGLQTLLSECVDIQDTEREATRPCPRCGYYNREDQRICSICREALSTPLRSVIQSYGRLGDIDGFMSAEMTRLVSHRRRIHLMVMVACAVCLLLLPVLIEGPAALGSGRVTFRISCMSIVLGALAGGCIVRIRPGFCSGAIFFAAAYVLQSLLRVLAGWTPYSLWREAISCHLCVGLPLAIGIGVVIGELVGLFAYRHGGRT